ncbi:MAG: hypothetical protein RIC55_24730 [Pirellulaceae bacterium]
MDKITFGSRFQAAAAKAYVYATSMISEALPPNLRVNLHLNSSYEGNPLDSHEVVYPADSERNQDSLQALEIVDAASELWRDNRVPEWIDLSVIDCTDELTIIRALCCGRFTDDESRLYHIQEGYPPFHVLSPVLPPNWRSVEDDGRFSLRWRNNLARDVRGSKHERPKSTNG